MTIRAIVTDIEGTTSSISFVHEVLFPYAYEAMESFLKDHLEDEGVAGHVKAVCEQEGIAECNAANVAAALRRWIKEDRKATELKAIQGHIWKKGYETGAYQAHVYDDAHDQLMLWHQQGLPLYVYSSGSIYAQKLFFGYSCFGDMLALFNGHFDTTTGAKQDEQSYHKIVAAIGLPAENILFLSDIKGELDAARKAGMKTAWLVRGADSLPESSEHRVVSSFAEIHLNEF